MPITPQQQRWGREVSIVSGSISMIRWLGHVWEVDASAGPADVYLPLATSAKIGSEIIMKSDSSANPVNVYPFNGSADTINGSAGPYVLNSQYEFATFYNDGTSVVKLLERTIGVADVDGSTLYYDSNGKLAIKPLGITDGLVSLGSGIIKDYDNTQNYPNGSLVGSNGRLYRAITTTTGTPGRYTNGWCQITEPGNSWGLSDISILNDVDVTLQLTDYIVYMFIDTTDRTITLPRISTLTGTHITNRAKQYIIVKYGYTNTLLIQTDAVDSYDDGNTVAVLTENGSALKLMTIAGNGNTWVRL